MDVKAFENSLIGPMHDSMMTTGNAFYQRHAVTSMEASTMQSPQKDAGKPVTQEEKEAFMEEMRSARNKIEFPSNPSLFPVSITIQKINQKNVKFKLKLDKERSVLPKP